jgi:hypothetical protein
MNKTLKTIAWICLALGLLGIFMDAGALIFGRRLAADRQAAFEEMRASAAKGNTPSEGNRCIAEDTNKDGKPDSDCLNLQAPVQPGQPGVGPQGFGRSQGHGGMMLYNHRDFNGGRLGGRGIFLMFFIALGPILAIVGAVILLVNREPKAAVAKEEKEAKKKEDKK